MKAILLCLLCTGCTTSIKHLSDPNREDDGYDLVCGGFERNAKLEVSIDYCHNVAPRGGNLVFIELEYHWSKE